MLYSTLEHICRKYTYPAVHEVLHKRKPLALPLVHLDIKKKNKFPGAELL